MLEEETARAEAGRFKARLPRVPDRQIRRAASSHAQQARVRKTGREGEMQAADAAVHAASRLSGRRRRGPKSKPSSTTAQSRAGADIHIKHTHTTRPISQKG